MDPFFGVGAKSDNGKVKRKDSSYTVTETPMLEWTGERFLPWVEDATIAYEHLHRYAFASQFVEGKRVLDLATGEGYGASLLARKAASVLGIDLDEATIRHASDKYDQANLRFLVGALTQVPLPASQCFDVIVCLEAIEHIEEHEPLLEEIKRLLVNHGLLIISTPNKVVYTDETGFENPFHAKELDFKGFSQLLNRSFKRTCFLGQHIYCNSHIWPVPAEPIEGERKITEFLIDRRSEFTLAETDRRTPRYFIALSTDGSADFIPRESVLVDVSDQFAQQTKQETERTGLLYEEALADLRDQLKESQKQVRSQEAELAVRADQIRSQEEALFMRADQVRSQEEELAVRADHARQLGQQIDQLCLERDRVTDQLNRTREELQIIKDGLGWKVRSQVRALKEALLPKHSRRRKVYDRWRPRQD